jgi:hypothetical protein
MPKFPEPPLAKDLAQRPAELRTLPAGTELWRIYMRGGAHPATWNQFRRWGSVASARFDHHEPPPHPQARGILYAAMQIAACVAEVFQARRVIDVTGGLPWLVGFTLSSPVALLDLTGTWPTSAGASMAINSGPRSRAQRWSRTVYDAFPDVHGLWYASSMYANTPALALYERAEPAIALAPFVHRPLNDPALRSALQRIATTLGYEMI